jgi:ABC-type antimicrobial peptide transport system permease subunit
MSELLTSPWALLGAAALLAVALLAVGRVPIQYNLRNLLVRWKTSLVTVLAFTLVVALLVGMLALVNGMRRLTESTAQPANVMILADGATDEAYSNLPPNVSVFSLPDDLQKAIARDEGGKMLVSEEVYVIVNQVLPNPKPGGAKRRFVQMRGLKDPVISARVHDLELLRGRWFAATGQPEAVLGEGVARTLGEDLGQGPLEPGAELDIGPLRWKVVGIMRSAGSTFGSEIWTRDTILQQRFGRVNSYNTFVARVKEPPGADAAVTALKASAGSAGTAFQPVTEKDYFEKLGSTNQQFFYAIVFVAFFVAVGGVFGVMNTMFAAISQRRKDIGVLRLLGYSRAHILVSFLLESLVIALVGGLAGCLLGLLAANGVESNSIASAGPGGGFKSIVLRLVVDGPVLVAGLLYALGMGLLGGLIPSVIAMRLRPLESLR